MSKYLKGLRQSMVLRELRGLNKFWRRCMGIEPTTDALHAPHWI